MGVQIHIYLQNDGMTIGYQMELHLGFLMQSNESLLMLPNTINFNFMTYNTIHPSNRVNI